MSLKVADNVLGLIGSTPMIKLNHRVNLTFY